MKRTSKLQLELLEGRVTMSATTPIASVTDMVIDPFSPSSRGSGRVGGIVADPDTIYVGTANGGVWKTTNGGTT